MSHRLRRVIAVLLVLVFGLGLLNSGCSTRIGRWFFTPTVMDDFRLSTDKEGLRSPVALAAFTSDELYGRISPDGLRLVYASNQKGSLDIWLRDLSTGMPERLTQHVAVDTQPTFSPDGETIAFVSMRDDVKGDIYLRDVRRDKLTRLTDRSTEDAFPVFFPDGKSLVFASGPEGDLRIVRLWLKDRRVEALTGSGATQPAISSDGRFLAYIQRDAARVNRLMLKDLESGRTRAVTADDYQCGFPAFSPDGGSLFFTRFYYTQAGEPLEGDEHGVIFRADLRRLGSLSPEDAEEAIEQISTGRRSHLFLAAHPEGLIYTTRQDGNLDVLMMPFDGLLPEFDNAARQFEFALSLDDDLDRLLAFRKLRRFPESAELQEASYLASRIDHDMLWYDKQLSNLERLDQTERPLGPWQGMARVDLAVLDVVSTVGLAARTGRRLEPGQVDTALRRLKDVQANYSGNRKVAAYGLLREADMLDLSGRNLDAIAAYEAVSREYADQPDITVQARLKLADLFALMNEAELQAGFYLTIFADYPDDEPRQRTAAKRITSVLRASIQQSPEIAALMNPPEFDAERRRIPEAIRERQRVEGRRLTDRLLVDRLRRVIEANPEYTLLGAVLQFQIGRIYHRLGDLDLAIRAMERVVTRYPQHSFDLTRATFALGAYSLQQSHDLRAAGRFNEAGQTYAQALDYYEGITRMYPPAHENHRRARREFLSLGLLKAGQNEFDRDIEQAVADYQRLVEFDPNVIQAHRKLIYYGVQRGDARELEARYKALVRENPSSFTGYYCLGYLATWRRNLSEKDLDEAEEHLRRAIGLNSQSSHAYLTLGWVAEMRELYLKKVAQGWLEEAIRLYDQAWRVNDRGADIQVEADILLNLGNAFVRLGNTWRYAYDTYRERQALNLPFLDPVQEALYALSFGRAAFNLNHYQEASGHFDRALQLARRTRHPRLQAEAIARQALNLQMQGDYEQSIQFFERSIATYRQVGQMDALAALVRSIALNHFYLGQRREAITRLKESLQLLEAHGTRSPGDFTRLALAPGMSLYPRGFDRSREELVNADLRQLILSDLQLFASSAEYVDYKIAFLDRLLAHAGGTDAEIMREQVVLANRRGRLALSQGEDGQALQVFDRAYRIGERIQSIERVPDDPDYSHASPETLDALDSEESTEDEALKFVMTPGDFDAQILNATSFAELLLRRDARGDAPGREELEQAHARLLRIMRRVAREQGDAALAPIRRELVWRLHTDLALTSLALARQPRIRENAGASGPDEAWDGFLAEARLYADAIHNLRLVLADTQGILDLAQSESPPELPPVEPHLILRMHLETLLNLADLAAYFDDARAPADENGQSMKLLGRAAAFCAQWRVDDLCWLVDMAKAERTRDVQLASATAQAFLTFPPAALSPAYLQNADGIRSRLLTAAARILLDSGDFSAAWWMLEQETRRLAVDELARVSAAVTSPDLGERLNALRRAERQYRDLAASQSPNDPETRRTESRKALATMAESILKEYEALKQVAPRLHGHVSVTPFSLDDVAQALDPGEAALAFIPLAKGLDAFILTKEGVRHVRITDDLAGLRRQLAKERIGIGTRKSGETADPKAVRQLGLAIFRPLREELAGHNLLYIDGDRLDPFLPWTAIVRGALKPDMSLLRIASLRGLADSFANRNIYVDSALFTVSDPQSGEAAYLEQLMRDASGRDAWRVVASPGLVQDSDPPLLGAAGIGVFDQPLRFEGGSAANIWINYDTKLEGFGHFSFVENLDALWRSNLLLFPQTHHTGRVRAERVCLERALTTFGVAGFVTFTQTPERSAQTAQALSRAVLSASTETRRKALDLALKELSGDETAEALDDLVLLWGHKGMDAEAARRYAEGALMPTMTQAINLQRAGAARAAVEQYELTLRLMRYLDNTTHLDRVLEMLVSQSAAIQDWDRAILYQREILARAQKVADDAPGDLAKLVSVIKAKEALSNHYAKARRYDEALSANQEIIDSLIANKREALTASYRGQRGIFFEFSARYPQALEQYLETLALFTQANNVAGRIEQSTNAARILRLHLSRYREARQYIEEALTLSKDADLAQQLRLMLELARVNFAMGGFQQAADISRRIIERARPEVADILNKGRAISQNASLTADQKKEQLTPLFTRKTLVESLIGQANLELVNALYRMGDYSQALAVYETGMALARAQNDRLRQIQFTNIQGLIYTQMGDTARAVEAFTWMLEQAQAIHSHYEQANALSNLGETYRKAGEFTKARDMFSRAMQIDRIQNSKLGLAFDNANLGLTFENMARDDEAVSHFTTALKISREIDSPINEAKSLLGLGRIALKRGQAEVAEGHLSAGLALVERLNMQDWTWRFHLQHGRLLLLTQAPDKALDAFLAGIDIIESMPPSVRQRDDAPKIEESRLELYDEAVDLLAAQGRRDEAFRLSERYRARHFLDLVGGVRPGAAGAAVAALFEAEATLANELRSADDALKKAGDAERAALRERYDSLSRDYTDTIRRLADVHAELPGYVTVSVAETSDLLAAIPKDAPVLSYYATPRRLVIFALDYDGLHMVTVDVTRDELVAAVHAYRRQVTNFHPVDETAQRLHDWLLAPLETWLEGRRQVLVVPFGVLHALPFAALHDGKDYLVARMRVGYLSSVNQLLFLAEAAPVPAGLNAPLAMGGPFVRIANDPLGELPFTAHELRALKESFPAARLAENADATLDAYRRMAPGQSWIHIATHAEFHPTSPFSSSLMLAPSGAAAGDLRLVDILAVPLKAELVSLSACDTALGSLSEGEGHITLSRAFLSAGARQVLASLWRVSDLSTSVLMKHWFRELRSYPPAEALQRAQQTVRKQFPHPAYWAGFRMEGHP